MRRISIIMFFCSFLAMAQGVGPSVTYEKFLQSSPPLRQVGVLKADPLLRADRWSIGCECLDRDMADFRQSFGLLCTSLKGKVIYKKPSFYAVRNMVNLLPDNVVPQSVGYTSTEQARLKVTGLGKDGKLLGAILYFSGKTPSSDLVWSEVHVAIEGLKLENPVLVEPITGCIFSLGRYHYSPNNPDRNYTLYLWDSPVFLVDRSTFSEINTDTLSEGLNNEF